jgi:hypothetical protein
VLLAKGSALAATEGLSLDGKQLRPGHKIAAAKESSQAPLVRLLAAI